MIAASPAMMIAANATRSQGRGLPGRSGTAGGPARTRFLLCGAQSVRDVANARPGCLAQRRDAARVDTAAAREAVLGLEPHHRGASAWAEAAIDLTRPVPTPRQPSLHFAHPSRAVRRDSRSRRRCGPHATGAQTGPQHCRRAVPTDRGSRARAATAAGGSLLAPNAVGAVMRVSAAASAARGHLQSTSSPSNRACTDRRDAGRRAKPRRGFSPGARAGR